MSTTSLSSTPPRTRAAPPWSCGMQGQDRPRRLMMPEFDVPRKDPGVASRAAPARLHAQTRGFACLGVWQRRCSPEHDPEARSHHQTNRKSRYGHPVHSSLLSVWRRFRCPLPLVDRATLRPSPVRPALQQPEGPFRRSAEEAVQSALPLPDSTPQNRGSPSAGPG